MEVILRYITDTKGFQGSRKFLVPWKWKQQALFDEIGGSKILRNAKVFRKIRLCPVYFATSSRVIIHFVSTSELGKGKRSTSELSGSPEWGRGSRQSCLRFRFSPYQIQLCGPGSSVGITTDYGLDGPGSNPGGDEIFRPSRPSLGPTQPPVKWGTESFPGVKCGRDILLTTHSILSAAVMEE